jgi:cobalt-zinc-cadmium efflux system membrane fusion protein
MKSDLHTRKLPFKTAILFALLLPAILFSCKGASEGDAADEEVISSSNEVTLSADQVKSAAIAFGKIEKHILSNDIHAKGKLVLPPQNIGSVCARMGGTIDVIKVNEGKRVRRGEELASLSSPEIVRLQQEYISGLSREELMEKEYQRQKTLNADKINSERKFQETESEYRDIQSRNRSLEIQMELLQIPISELKSGKIRRSSPIISPIDGVIEKIDVTLGQYVEPNSVLFQVVNKERLFVELMVFEKDVPYVMNGQRVSFELTNMGGEEYEAKVWNIAETVEESARTVRVLAEFKNSSPIVLPGMFVAAEIHTDEQSLDALPEEAVIAIDNANYIYCTTTPDNTKQFTFFKVPVKTGFKEMGYIQVEPLTAIPSEGRVVIKGTYFIRSEELKLLK